MALGFQGFRFEPETETRAVTTITFFEVVKFFSPALRELLVRDILIRLCGRIPYAFVILWAINRGGHNAQQFGYLVAFEMATAMFCYLPVAHLADRYGRSPFVLVTCGLLTLFPIMLLRATRFGWLALAFVVRRLKEFGELARKALIIGAARLELRTRTYGNYNLIRDCVGRSGSLLGPWLWHFNPQTNLIEAAIYVVLGTGWFWWRRIHRTRPAEGGQ